MPLTGRELAKLAVLKGWKEVRVKGSHHQFKKDGVPYILLRFQFIATRC